LHKIRRELKRITEIREKNNYREEFDIFKMAAAQRLKIEEEKVSHTQRHEIKSTVYDFVYVWGKNIHHHETIIDMIFELKDDRTKAFIAEEIIGDDIKDAVKRIENKPNDIVVGDDKEAINLYLGLNYMATNNEVYFLTIVRDFYFQLGQFKYCEEMRK
jgi:hypothetical protein